MRFPWPDGYPSDIREQDAVSEPTGNGQRDYRQTGRDKVVDDDYEVVTGWGLTIVLAILSQLVFAFVVYDNQMACAHCVDRIGC